MESLIMQPLNGLDGSNGSQIEKKNDESNSDDDLYDNINYVDPRNNALGMRFITSSQGMRDLIVCVI